MERSEKGEKAKKGTFQQRLGWVSSILLYLGKLTNLGRKGGAFIWWDETGLRLQGSPKILELLQSIEQELKKAAKEDTDDLSKGRIVVPIDQTRGKYDVFQDNVSSIPVLRLPCPTQFMNQRQCEDWLRKEIVKDVVEQGRHEKIVNEVKWGVKEFEPRCWEGAKHLVSWENFCNPANTSKKQVALPTGYRVVDILKLVVRSRLEQKGGSLYCNFCAKQIRKRVLRKHRDFVHRLTFIAHCVSYDIPSKVPLDFILPRFTLLLWVV